MKNNDSLSRKLFLLFNNIIMIGIVLVMVYPLLYVIFASFSSPTAFMAHTGLLWRPLNFTLAAYQAVLKNKFLYSGYGVTILVAVSNTVMQLFLTLLGAYFFTRKNVMHQKFLMLLIVITMYFGGGLVPTYLLYKSIGLENSLWGLILPGVVSPTNLIIMRTAFYGVPDSLVESATIDGAGHLKILFKVIAPLVLSTVAVIAMYAIVGCWNSWFMASILIRDKSKYPLQLILREILIQNDTSSMENTLSNYGERAMISMTIQYAVIVVSTAPVLCAYPFVQKYFVTGTMMGAVKE